MGVGRVGQCPKLCAYVSLARWKRASLTQPLCNRNRSESGLGPHDEARRPVLWSDADQNLAPIEIDMFLCVNMQLRRLEAPSWASTVPRTDCGLSDRF